MSVGFQLVVVFVLAVLGIGAAFFIRYKIEYSRYLGVWVWCSAIILSSLFAGILGTNQYPILAGALSILIFEVLYFISPSNDWPKLYVRFLQIGYGLGTIVLWGEVVSAILHPSSFHNGYPYSFIIPAIVGILIVIFAAIFLRPRGRSLEGIF